MEKMQAKKLLVNINKCSFLKSELVYLGFVVSNDALEMDPEKVQAILDWPSPQSIYEVRSFHGLASFYRKFIKKFSGICSPIVETIRKDKQPFKWTAKAKSNF